MTVHFVNLTNGLLCCKPPNPHYLRIQSTWCEQKRWPDVLQGVGPDFYYHLATGADILVHDVSEKPRYTRACWQGVALIVYVCGRAWDVPTPIPIMRNGHNATEYFERVYSELPDRLVKQIKYYRQFWRGQPLHYRLCDYWQTSQGRLIQERQAA